MVYIYLHIPRTGGTFVETSMFDCFSRENDEYLQHYWYVDNNWSDTLYEQNLIPRLFYRTKLQQKQLKLITGHSTYVNSHSWLKFHTEKRIFTTIRNPIKRLLSSFNYRHMQHQLTQDPAIFTDSFPQLLSSAIAHNKIASDYDTLYEYYQDSTWEHNIQSKWIIKSFLKKEGRYWQEWPEWQLGADSSKSNDFQVASQTWPNWMSYEDVDDIDYYDLVTKLKEQIWWLGTTETLSNDIEDFAKLLGTSVKETANKNNSSRVKPYWTYEEVMKQPDIQKIIDSEKHDFKLYELAKKQERPF